MERVPLNLTKVAFGCDRFETLAERFRIRAEAGVPWALTTRYLPKRHEELVGGSLFWILKHQLIARTPILGFGEAEQGRTAIHMAPELIQVQPRPKRAHQGWRYLDDADAPADLGGGDAEGDAMPPALIGKLAGLGLL